MAPLVSTRAACGLSAPSSRCMPSSAVIVRGSRAAETAAGWMQWGWKVAGDSPAMAEVALGSPSPALPGSQALPSQRAGCCRSSAHPRCLPALCELVGPCTRGDAWQECAISPLCLQVHFPSGSDTNAGKRLQAPYVGRESTLFVCYSSRKLSRSLTPRTPQ